MKLLPLFVLLAIPTPAFAQGGAAARVAVEVMEGVMRRGASEATERTARELAEFGGQKAVREILEQAEREGGELLMRQVASQTEKHGVLALQALKGAGAPVIRAVDGVPAELAENSLRALVREPVAMRQLATEFGSTALETAAKHSGLAVPIGRRLGTEGLETARHLNLDQAAMLSRNADSLAQLPAAERSQLLGFIRQSPAKALAWVEKHPRLLVAASATTAVVLAREEIFGIAATGQQGFIERAAGAVYRAFQKPINWALGGVAAIVLAWGGFKVWAVACFLKRRRRTA
ncbi:MAG: hypothetical protein JWM59_680 [Verrucomicrobiales bacterium]|nr:hypothetical protein [Verrucomicrobiales bacterium]